MIQAGKKLSYKIIPTVNTATSISKNVFESRSKKPLVVHISCLSIKFLLIHFGQLILLLNKKAILAGHKPWHAYTLESKDKGDDDMNEKELTLL